MSMVGVLNFLSGLSLTDSIADSGINEALTIVKDVVNTLMLVIYVVLGLFLVVKGALLGMQIVKAADEPQVRQEKIGALKWLVIGVAIAYGVAGLVDILTGYFLGLASK